MMCDVSFTSTFSSAAAHLTPAMFFLLGRSMDIANAIDLIQSTGEQIQQFNVRCEAESGNSYTREWFREAVALAESINVTVDMPRRCGIQTQRANPPVENEEQYYTITIAFPFLGELSARQHFIPAYVSVHLMQNLFTVRFQLQHSQCDEATIKNVVVCLTYIHTVDKINCSFALRLCFVWKIQTSWI